MAKRVESGLFVSRCPFGYCNHRVNGRALSEIHPLKGPKAQRIFELDAYHGQTLDSILYRLADEGLIYSDNRPRFQRSELYELLTDRAYMGRIKYHGQWHPGVHEPLIDHSTWDRVHELLGGKIHRSHEMTYTSELIRCGQCGQPVTGKRKQKQTKSGIREYVYYRCSAYNKGDHPRTRLTEAELDVQVLAQFYRLGIEDEAVRGWFVNVLRSRTVEQQQASRERGRETERQLTHVMGTKARLLEMRIDAEIDADTYAHRVGELRDCEARVRLQIEACGRGCVEEADLAARAFQLSQGFRDKRVTAHYEAKRRILKTLCLDLTLNDRTLVPAMRKPFDLLVKGLISHQGRGERI